MAELRFRNKENGREFLCTEGDAVYFRVTGHEAGENEFLGEVKPAKEPKEPKAPKEPKVEVAPAEAPSE